MHASPTRFDIDGEALLAPIPGDDPTGDVIVHTAEYAGLKEARREDPDLPQGVWVTDVKRADWPKVIRLAEQLLRSRSKDVQVAAWLCEALSGNQGVGGLTQGLTVLAGLFDRYGRALHPRSEGNDSDAPQILIFEWLDRRLQVQMMTQPVTAPPSNRDSGFTFGDLRNARLLATVGRREEKPSAKGGPPPVTLPVFNGAVRITPSEFYHQLYWDLVAASAALSALKVALNTTLGDQAPSMSRLAGQLDEMGVWTYTTLQDRGEDPAMMTDADPVVGEAGAMTHDDMRDAGSSGALADSHGPIASRREAYRLLAEIADYLARTEPHSPTPYLLHRLVQWRDLPLPVLLQELSRGRKDVAAIFDLLTTSDGTP